VNAKKESPAEESGKVSARCQKRKASIPDKNGKDQVRAELKGRQAEYEGLRKKGIEQRKRAAKIANIPTRGQLHLPLLPSFFFFFRFPSQFRFSVFFFFFILCLFIASLMSHRGCVRRDLSFRSRRQGAPKHTAGRGSSREQGREG